MTIWNNKLSIAVKQIDQHNIKLCQLINHIYKASTNYKNPFKFKCEFGDLLDLTVFHFACEEIWMAHTSYKNVSEHQKDHKNLIRMLFEIHTEFMAGNKSALSRLPIFIQSVKVHIKTMDASYGHFIASDRLSATLVAKPDKSNIAR